MMQSEANAREQAAVEERNPRSMALEHLRHALKIVDLEGMPPEIGARLDHVICSIEALND